MPGRKNILVWGLGLALLVYHLGNRPWRGVVQKPARTSHAIEFRWGKHHATSILPSTKIPAKIDRSTTWIGEWGFIARYLAGQYAFEMIALSLSPLKLFHRKHIGFQYPRMKRNLSSDFVTATDTFFRSLQENGVTPLLLPIPTHFAFDRHRLKGSLPSEDLWGDLRPHEHEDPHSVYATLQKHPNTVDLFQTYGRYAADHPHEEIFVPYDFHWTSLGIALAAQAAVLKLESLGEDVPRPRLVATGKSVSSYRRTLLGFLQLPNWYLDTRGEFAFSEPLYRLEKARPAPGRVIVAGTSFSLNQQSEQASLVHLLSDALGREAVVSAYHGGGARGGLVELAKKGFELQRGDLLIWEFPFYLATEENGAPLPEFSIQQTSPISLN